MASRPLPDPGDNPLRYQMPVPARRDVYRHIALWVAIAIVAAPVLVWFLHWKIGGGAGFAAGAALGALAVYAGADRVVRDIASTRPWWGCEVRGSVYRDRRTFRAERRYDLAKATSACVVHKAREIEGVTYRNLYLRLSLEDQDEGMIWLANDYSVVSPGQAPARLMLALADVLAENPRTVTGLAVADLRSLATASPGQVSRWIRTTKAGTSWW